MANPYGRSNIFPLVNKSGASVAAGDLVYLGDGATADSFTTGTTANRTGGIGIAQQTIASNATGLVLLSGYAALVNVNASVTINHYGASHTVAKQATDVGTSRAAGTCLYFLTGGTTPDAIVWQPDLGGGSGMTNPMSAVGDIIQGGTAGAPQALAAPATGKVLQGAGATTLVAWKYPPGYEIAYVEFTSPVTLTGTTEGAAVSIVSAGSVAFDGSTIVLIEAYIPNFVNDGGTTNNGRFWLYADASSIGEIGRTTQITAATATGYPVTLRRRLTPSNASHTYEIRGSSAGAAVAGAGAGGASTVMPGFIRITKVSGGA